MPTLDPTTLAGKVLWLRGKDLGSGSVTTWTDQSGTAHNATSAHDNPTVAAASTPAGGKSLALNHSRLDLPGLGLTGAGEMWVVLKNTNPSASDAAATGWKFGTDATAAANNYYDQFGAINDDFGTSARRNAQITATATATSSYPTEPATNAVDGNASTYWTTNGVVAAGLRLELPGSPAVTSYAIRRRDDSAVSRMPKDWTFEGSNDGSAWTTLDTRTAQTWPTAGENRSFSFSNTVGYRYYRLNITANNGDATYSSLAEIATTPAKIDTSTWRLYRVSITNGGAGTGTWKNELDGVALTTVAGATIAWQSAPRLSGDNLNSSASGFIGNYAEVLVRSQVSTTDEIAWLIDYFNTEHGLTVPGGSPPPDPTPTTTLAMPVTAGLAFSAQSVVTTTLAMAVSVGLAFSATAIPRTTVDMPVTAGLSFTASTVEAGKTTHDMPVTAGLSFDARTVVSTTLDLPTTAGLTFEATKQEPTTLDMPVAVGLAFAATVGGGTTLDMPVTAELSFVATGGDTMVSPWTADLSQRALLPFVASGSATFTPPLAAIPATIVERPIGRESVIVPDLTTVAEARVDPTTGQIAIPDNIYDAFPVVNGIVGVPHIIIDGRDVTYFRDARTLVTDDRAQEPFGDAQLTVDFPQITTLDDRDNPDLAWLRVDATVHYVLQLWDEDGPTGVVETLFHGRLVSDDSGNDETRPQKTWSARGDVWAAASFVHLPRLMMNPVDIGTQIPKTLNAVTSRRFPKMPTVTTGNPTLQRGNRGEKVMEYVQGLLGSEGWTDAGRQWTVAKKPGSMNTYQMRLKKNGVDWIVTNGMRGLEVSLSSDSTQSRNVIWGYGQRSDGGVWMNKKFPDAGRTAPAYPFSSPGSVMTIGTTDGMTSTGEGVSTWQRRAKALGFRITVDGVFSSADAAVTRALQRQYSILVDGVVGPQTWAESFDVGALGADPDQWIRLPLAWLPGTQPFRYRANGSLIGPDPAYDPSITINSDDIDMGTDVSLADGKRSAQQIIDRENPPSLSGTLTLTADPREGSRFLIQPGDRIKIIGYEGRDVVLHIADRERAWNGKGPVTLQVAETAYDALTLAQIRQRNNANRADTARRPGKVRTKPVIDPWDCESNAGQIERHALYGGLWTVIRVPMSEVGSLAEINLQTSPPTRFSWWIFAKPITSADMIRYVGSNPLALDNPGEENRELLEDRFGWIQGWGRLNDALGFYPGSQGSGHALTGRAKESGEPYWSPSGYLYLAEYAAGSTFIEGDMRATPPEA